MTNEITMTLEELTEALDKESARVADLIVRLAMGIATQEEVDEARLRAEMYEALLAKQETRND
jgi:hypothetical protein